MDSAPPPLAHLGVLIVDDDVALGATFTRVFTDRGHRAVHVTTGEAALAAVQHGIFHVVLVDLVLPGLAGVPLLERLRTLVPDLAIIVITGNPSLETAVGAIDVRADAYLSKPVTSTDLVDKVTRLVRRRGVVLLDEHHVIAMIGQGVNARRTALGLTLKQLARRTGMSISMLSGIERAYTGPSVGALLRLATALHCRIADFLGGL